MVFITMSSSIWSWSLAGRRGWRRSGWTWKPVRRRCRIVSSGALRAYWDMAYASGSRRKGCGGVGDGVGAVVVCELVFGVGAGGSVVVGLGVGVGDGGEGEYSRVE